jgi:hypothetical protein
MYDLSAADNNTRTVLPSDPGWEDYYTILHSFYQFFCKLGHSYQMKLQNTATSLAVSVKGGTIVEYTKVHEGPAITGSNRLHLQSHWGSGVTFSNISIS